MLYIPKTNLEIQLNTIINASKNLTNYRISLLSAQLLSILLGFFISTVLLTILTQTGDWSIVAAAIIVTNQEIISKTTYENTPLKQHKSKTMLKTCLKYCNNIKIGMLYGLFVDAFKLGS